MNWREKAQEHALAEHPREACGLVVVYKGREIYWPCRNLAEGDEHFLIDPQDWVQAEDAGAVVAVVHSHPNYAAEPSEPDLVACEASGLPWRIVSTPSLVWRAVEPSGYEAPLEGREFRHGVTDCYSLIRDWYKRHKGIELPDFERRQEWWLKGEDLYLDNFGAAGFVDVTGQAPQEGDVMLFQFEGAPVPHHAGVYLSDDTLLHHLQGRLSSRDAWSGAFQQTLVKVLRHAGNSTVRGAGA